MPINLHFPLFLGGGPHLILWEKKPKSYHQGQTKEGRWMNWKWAPTSYKWSCNLYTWSWTLLTPGRGPSWRQRIQFTGCLFVDDWAFFHEFPKNTLHESQIKLKFSKKNPNQPRIAKSKSPTPNSFLISEKMKSQDFTSKIFLASNLEMRYFPPASFSPEKLLYRDP